jgi:hypothetical protein
VEVDLDAVVRQMDGHAFWLSYLKTALATVSKIGLHLAVFSRLRAECLKLVSRFVRREQE